MTMNAFFEADTAEAGVIETDQQIGRRSHKLPEDVHLENVGGNHQTEHREAEQRQECVETLESCFPHAMMVAHVTVAVQMHHERDGGDHNKEQCRNRVEEESDADYKIIVKRQPVLIENHSLKAGVGVGIYKFGIA